MRVLIALAIVLLAGRVSAWDNSVCWGDAKRVEISCVPLTKSLLSSLKFASREFAMKALRSEGRQLSASEGDTLHFVGNAKRGNSGILNLRFQNDRAVIVHALIDQSNGSPLEYIWNDQLGLCSDFPGSIERCNKHP